MNKTPILPPFKRFCVTIGNLPSSYVESMSYYECIMWLCKYLKDTVIPTVNSNAEAVNELINWFNNLDVQEEINNKLDEMVEDGTLEELINSKIFGDLNSQVQENKLNIFSLSERINSVNSNLTNSIGETNSRIDETNQVIGQVASNIESIGSVNPIPVSSTDDMTDTSKVYLLTTSGYWYYYNGSTWVAGGVYQSSGLGEDIRVYNMIPSLQSSNMLNKIDIVLDRTLDEYGNTNVVTAGYFTTAYIPVKNGVTYYTNYPRWICYYDTSKTFIERVAISPIEQSYSFTPEVDGFVRLSYRTWCKDLLFVSTENKRADEYSINGYVKTTENLKFLDKHKNMINTNNVTLFYASTPGTGALYFDSRYCTIDIAIPTPGSIWVNNIRNGQYLAEDKSYISNAISEETNVITEKTISNQNIKYIRLTIRLTDLPKAYCSYLSSTAIDYYGKYLPSDIKVSQSNLIDSQNGKLLYAFGDSIINGHLSGISCIDTVCTSKQIQYKKYAVNGATVVNGANDIQTQITGASATVPDYVLFNGGTNDAYSTTTVGNITSDYDSELDTSTFCGAFEDICRKLRNKYVSSQIMYIAVHKMVSRNKDVQQTLYEKEIAICEKYSIPVIDIYKEGGLNTFNSTMQNLYTYDTLNQDNPTAGGSGGSGTHPNTVGYELFYDPIIKRYLTK